MTTLRINCIATPRNISTALMYSFAQRDDTQVIDEPFYAHYLKVSGRDHPGRDDVLAHYEQDARVVQSELLRFDAMPVLYLKNMAHHIRQLPLEWLEPLVNILLIRDPKQLIASLAQVLQKPTMDDIGLDTQHAIFAHLAARGQEVRIVDSGELLKNPALVLTVLCRQLGIPMELKMLSWKAGPRPEDGIWAPYWYANVHTSTGFARQKTSDRALPDHCLALYDKALPLYISLYERAIRTSPG